MSVQGGSNRRQPTRSVRTTANRPSNYYAKPFSYRNSFAAPVEIQPAPPSPPGFFPAISFFTDAVTALPKEMQKHLTVLKETDGKLHHPDQAIYDAITSLSKLPPAPRAPAADRAQAYLQLSLAASVSGSAAASVANGMTPRRPQTFGEHESAVEQYLVPDPHSAQREMLYGHLVKTIRDVGTAMDEKNMILTAANETLARQLSRFDSALPHIESEISEEARLGSNTHWALPHMKELRRTNGSSAPDRGRRDVTNVNNLAAAAAAVHEGEIAATRSEARREAMLAKRSRARDPDSDQEERAPPRKHVSTKVRKVAEAAADGKAGSSGQAQKRRKIEKPPASERSLGAALGGRLGGARASPRGSPAPDANRKKAKAPAAASASRKKANVDASSINSSPTRGTFPTSTIRRPSPSRQQSAKARQQSLQNIAQEEAKDRRPSLGPGGMRKNDDAANTAVAAGLSRDDTILEEPPSRGRHAHEPSPVRNAQQRSNGSSRRRESAIKSERPNLSELRQNSKADEAPTPPIGRHSRAASRSSKPATPVSAGFGEGGAQMARSRSTRNGGRETNGSAGTAGAAPKRSHKKGGNGASVVAEDSPATSEEPDEQMGPKRRLTALHEERAEAGDTGDEEDFGLDDEPRYCSCHRVSFGDMIACDNERCPVEWFHLECVGLKTTPKGNAKWYCSKRCEKEAKAAGSSA